jgi:hypothetical protein
LQELIITDRKVAITNCPKHRKPKSHLRTLKQLRLSKNKQGQYMQFLTYNWKKTLHAHQQIPERWLILTVARGFATTTVCYANSLMFYVL